MIHPLSNVHPGAQIGNNVTIAAFASIEDDVVIGDDCYIHSGAVLMAGTRVGRGCKIFPGAILGAEPQDLKFVGEYSTLQIGDHTTIREYCTLNRGTQAAGTTIIGSHCLLMAYVHVAHDCIVADRVVLANNVNLAGHVEVGEHTVVGGMSGIIQFVKVAAHAMIAGGVIVRKDVPPYTTAARDPVQFMGVNKIGLSRRDFAPEKIRDIENAYRLLYYSGLNRAEALEAIVQESPFPEVTGEIIEFVNASTRGIIRGPKQDATVED